MVKKRKPKDSNSGGTVAYGRVSTHDQDDIFHAADQQKSRLRNSIPIVRLYFDIESGDNPNRAEFRAMMREVQAGRVDTIIATRWDRLTRNELVYLQLKETLKSCGVQLYLLDGGWVDLSTASGELSADMNVLFAVHERRMLRERVQKGQEHRRHRKAACARAPFGYMTENERYRLDRRPIICLLSDRPSHYLNLSNEPDDSPHLLGISRADIARHAIDLLLENESPAQVLKQLYQTYGVPIPQWSGGQSPSDLDEGECS
ncbi:MAG: recombinase family protein [Elainellaceae cyanobacterium]